MKEILDEAKRQLQNKPYLVSWHLSQDLNLPTAKVNYEMKKAVNRGEFVCRVHKNKYCTFYALTEENLPKY